MDKLKISKEHMANLRSAIKEALCPGQYLYVKDDKPCCVIGQLAYKEGASISDMKRWSDTQIVRLLGGCEDPVNVHVLGIYPYGLLSELQEAFDYPEGISKPGSTSLYPEGEIPSEGLRKKLNQIVDKYVEEE